MFNITAYTGAAISDPDNSLYEKVRFKDKEKQNLDRTINGGWVAMQEHYFLSAWIPSEKQNNHFYSHANKRLDLEEVECSYLFLAI